MDKALGYLQRAVALSPHDANILDSYGWALYRAGKVADATGWLEKAVERMPSDSTILDHLGDAYWSAGRHAEARFQWQRARDLTDDTAFRTAMDGKIKNGLALDHAGAILHKEAKL
jgi:Flp pilus assembly protein TadD